MAQKKKKRKDSKKKPQEAKSGFLSSWFDKQKKQKPVLKFAVMLALTMGVFFSISFTEFFENNINLPIVKGYAVAGKFLVNLLGLDTIVEGTHINGELFSMNIGKGCDAVSPTVLFMVAIGVYPTVFANKWKWLIAAPFAFALLNLIRIVSLYLLGAYVPNLFDFAHIEFWQGVFISITVLAWFSWLFSVKNKNKSNELI